jgi:tripartite ATP-independent transporter DctM subunit
MDPLLIGSLLIVAMVAIIALGVPIAVAITLVAAIGLWGFESEAFLFATLTALPYDMASRYDFVVIPMFVLMGILASASGMISELYTAAHRWTSAWRGNLLFATTLSSAGFAAISGSTVVNAVTFTRVALPEMVAYKYDSGLSAGCIAAAGTLAALIPPSLGMVVYGILTGQSIGALLMAGAIPGMITAGAYLVGIRILVRLNPALAPAPSDYFSWLQKFTALKGLWAVLLLAALVLGGIYTGAMPPSAAGAVGASGTLLIALARRRLAAGQFWESIQRTATITTSLFIILIGGLLFSRVLVITGFIEALTDLVIASSLSGPVFLAGLVVMYIVLGMFIEPMAMLIITIPFVMPVVNSLGLDPIWFGVIVIKLIEIATITPPIGINLFAVMSAADGQVTSSQLFRGILPFVGMEFLVLLTLLLFPALSTWLPDTIMN